jgi:predicted transcriptional regulator of viral defense system
MATRKTIEGRGADLVAHFAQHSPPAFETRDAAEFLGIDAKATSTLLGNLVARGWLVRNRRGLFEVAPIWATPDLPYDPDRFSAIAQWAPEPYYVGFRSALEIRDWLDHPVRGRIWIAVPRQRHVPVTVRDRVTWVVLRQDRFSWGCERLWIGGQVVCVSDPERSILDCLHLPRHAGGITEVAGVLVRVWSSLDRQHLVEHSDRLSIDAVRRRLGYLLDTLSLPGSDDVVESLARGRSSRRRSPVILDPALPAEGSVDIRWGVRVNVDPSELVQAGRT